MLKFLMVFGDGGEPRTFTSTRFLELPEVRVYLEGPDLKMENFFEGLVQNKGIIQSITPVQSSLGYEVGNLDELLSFLAEVDGFVSGVVYVGEWVVFRDFIGLIPLFAGGEPFTVTNIKSEAKQRGLSPLKPGTALRVSARTQETYYVPQTYSGDVTEFLEKLTKAVKKYCPTKTAVFFSGGIDSLILAKIIYDNGLSPTLLTVGVKGSADFDAAEKAAGFLGLDLEKIFVDEVSVRKILGQLYETLGPMEAMDAAIAAAMAVLSRKAAELGFFGAVLGQGADEVFGGYMKYERILLTEGYERLAEVLMKDLAMLGMDGLVRDFTAVRMGGAYPLPLYLTKEVFEAGLAVPVQLKVALVDGRPVRKHFLRQVCRELGLGEFAETRKKALQYGSGIEKLVKRIR